MESENSSAAYAMDVFQGWSFTDFLNNDQLLPFGNQNDGWGPRLFFFSPPPRDQNSDPEYSVVSTLAPQTTISEEIFKLSEQRDFVVQKPSFGNEVQVIAHPECWNVAPAESAYCFMPVEPQQDHQQSNLLYNSSTVDNLEQTTTALHHVTARAHQFPYHRTMFHGLPISDPQAYYHAISTGRTPLPLLGTNRQFEAPTPQRPTYSRSHDPQELPFRPFVLLPGYIPKLESFRDGIFQAYLDVNDEECTLEEVELFVNAFYRPRLQVGGPSGTFNNYNEDYFPPQRQDGVATYYGVGQGIS